MGLAARRSVDRRQAYGRQTAGNRQMYVYGNVVTKPVYEPERRTKETARPKKVSQQVKNNRRLAMGMNRPYVIFLAAVTIVMLAICVNYVQLRSELISRSKNITALQEELSALSEENLTKYNVIMDSVNLEEVREKAINEFGMSYASEEQVVEYDNPTGDYIKQYDQIPEKGVLASAAEPQK